MQEIEVKFLNIDREVIEAKLREIGAEKVGDYHYQRKVFDYPDLRLDTAGAWVRLRDEGDQVTLAFKQRLGWKEGSTDGDDEGMYEAEVVVSDFTTTAAILEKIGLVEKFHLENKRTRWIKDGVEFDIDTWPALEPYLEIEASNQEDLGSAIGWLGLEPALAKTFSTTQIYELAGIHDKDYSHITFTEMRKKE